MPINRMRFPIFALLLIVGFPRESCAVTLGARTLDVRVCEADVIVVGELADVKRRFFSLVRDAASKSPGIPRYFDSGKLTHLRVMKANGIEDLDNSITVSFASGKSTKSEYNPGAKGIWLLTRDGRMDQFFIPWENFIPLSEEKKVLTVLKGRSCGKA